MPLPDSVAGDERLRLFLALRLPEPWLDAISAWQLRAFAGARARVVPREHVHVTLVFLGSTPASALPGIIERLELAARPVELRPVGYRETRSAAMLTFEDLGGHGRHSRTRSAGTRAARGSRTSRSRAIGRPRGSGRSSPIRYEHMF